MEWVAIFFLLSIFIAFVTLGRIRQQRRRQLLELNMIRKLHDQLDSKIAVEKTEEQKRIR